MNDFQEIIAKAIGKVLIPLIPLHICGIFAKITAEGKILSTIKLFAVIFTMIIILQLLYLFVLYTLMFFYSRKNPFIAFRNMLPAYFAALGTQSSAATIPITLQCANNNGVREEVSDFVIPLCATIHLAGDTVTLVLGAMGIMAMHGMNTSFSFMLPYILMLGVTMVAAPGIPGGGVMAALGLLEKMLGFTPGQQSLMIALHFSQDSFGTATNVTGDGAIALVVDKIYDSQKH
ncbi:MAG: cation:dicarboxylate symporter family transporter, partial [Lentisphaeria bacterium]